MAAMALLGDKGTGKWAQGWSSRGWDWRACRLASDESSAAALRPIAAKVADAVAAHLGGRELPHVRNAACQLLLALAALDSDALWLLLFRLSAQVPQVFKSLSACSGLVHYTTPPHGPGIHCAQVAYVCERVYCAQDPAQPGGGMQSPRPGLLPPLGDIFPKQAGRLGMGQEPALARRLLGQVERMQPAWHRTLQEAAA